MRHLESTDPGIGSHDGEGKIDKKTAPGDGRQDGVQAEMSQKATAKEIVAGAEGTVLMAEVTRSFRWRKVRSLVVGTTGDSP